MDFIRVHEIPDMCQFCVYICIFLGNKSVSFFFVRLSKGSVIHPPQRIKPFSLWKSPYSILQSSYLKTAVITSAVFSSPD